MTDNGHLKFTATIPVEESFFETEAEKDFFQQELGVKVSYISERIIHQIVSARNEN